MAMTSVPSAHWDHSLPSPSPQEARVWGGCGHPGPLEFTQLRYSPHTPPIPWRVWRRGKLSSQPPSSLGPPLPTGHTWSPPPIHLHFKENRLHLFPIHLHFNSPWGGRAGRLAFKPSTPIGGLESTCPALGRGAVTA